MSYDLFFRPRSEAIDANTFADYFARRLDYTVELPQVVYQNDETGVYFIFELLQPGTVEEGELEYAVSLNINYYRPSYFILEAEPEVTAFVRQFDLLVSDPQMDGMGDGDYNPDLLIRGWNHGNAFGHRAAQSDETHRTTVRHLPSEVLKNSWAWNFNRRSLQERLGEGIFVPKILYLTVDGAPATAATWVDGIPIAVPDVDFFIVGRKELAPRKLFRRLEDHTFVATEKVRPIFERHRSHDKPGLVLSYEQPPPDVVAFVQSLPRVQPDAQGVAPDSMLDRELVQGAL